MLTLDELEGWAQSKGLLDIESTISFIVQANLSYEYGQAYYLYNSTLPSITLDLEGPDMTLLTSGYSLSLGATYDDPLNNLLTMALSSVDADFDRVEVQYKYVTPATADWDSYGIFEVVGTQAEISLDLLPFRDDNITLRFVGYDVLSNSKLLYDSSYWFIKEFNNHEKFVIEGISSGMLYGLDGEEMVDLEVKIIPVDNDITKILVTTGYETFSLTYPVSEQDHLYFEDDGIHNEDIRLNSTFYPIVGSDLTFIKIRVVLFQGAQGNEYLTEKEVIITVTSQVFADSVEISNLNYNLTSSQDNIAMSFVNDTTTYSNLHSIPYIVNNAPPLLKLYNIEEELVASIPLHNNLG